MSVPFASSFGVFLIECFGIIPKTFIWWYSDGLQQILTWVRHRLAYRMKALALRSWMKHLFQPMYGQRDFAGRAISIVMRFLVLIWRAIVLFFTLILYIVAVSLWLLLPAFTTAILLLNLMSALTLIRL